MKLKQLLLEQNEDNDRRLKELLDSRLQEGHGECLFDVGLEDSGEGMGLSREDWDAAYARVVEVAKQLRAETRILMTRNAGGEHDVKTEEKEREKDKDKGVSGKLLVRRVPEEIDDVIETRIAVVGNGMFSVGCRCGFEEGLINVCSRCWQIDFTWCACERGP